MKRRGVTSAAPPILLGVFFVLIVTAAATKSATYDEPVHIYSGWRILTRGDFSTNHEHPPLMKVAAALPLTLMGVRPPSREPAREIDQWSISHDFLYHANDGDRLLRAARLPIALFAVFMAWAVHRHAARVLGGTAALVALALVVFEPNVLGHAGLVTTDLGITALTFLTFTAFLGALRSGSWRATAGAGVLLGLALLAKFTAVLLLPILAAGGTVLLLVEPRIPGGWRRFALSLAAVSGIALLVLNAGYGFSGAFSSLRDFTPESEAFRQRAAGPWGALPLPVPVEYVRGFDHAEAGGQRWAAYLFGEHSMTGWRHYYLTALLVKTPLPLLLLTAAGLILHPWAVRERSGYPKGTDLLLHAIPPLVILTAFTVSSNLKNIGLRYILPVIPFMALIAASVVRVKSMRPWIPWALVGWQALAALWIYPDFLTFFNLTVGGPSRGAEVLLDSNLDWGQDLKGLGRWIRENRVERIYVDYFGRGCLEHEGVRSTPDFEGGLIAVSATHLKGVYSTDKDRYRFLWDLQPRAVIGGSIRIYDAPRPPDWKPKGAPAEGT